MIVTCSAGQPRRWARSASAYWRRAVWTMALTRRRRSASGKLSHAGRSPRRGIPIVGVAGVVAVWMSAVSRLDCGVIGLLLSTRYLALAQVAHEGREIT